MRKKGICNKQIKNKWLKDVLWTFSCFLCLGLSIISTFHQSIGMGREEVYLDLIIDLTTVAIFVFCILKIRNIAIKIALFSLGLAYYFIIFSISILVLTEDNSKWL